MLGGQKNLRIQNVLFFHHVCLVGMMKKWEGKCILLLCPYWNLKQWDSKGNFKISCSWPFFQVFSCVFREKEWHKPRWKIPPSHHFPFSFSFQPNMRESHFHHFFLHPSPFHPNQMQLTYNILFFFFFFFFIIR